MKASFFYYNILIWLESKPFMSLFRVCTSRKFHLFEWERVWLKD